MLKLPEMTKLDTVFGNIEHMPRYGALPEDFKRHNGNDYCEAISTWFFSGGDGDGDRLVIGDKVFTPKDGVNGSHALAAIRAVLCSFEPKHEHKTAGCAFMLSEWFDMEKSAS